ncbi:serine--tRNA ligase [Proteinivorax hydrogeniformans]|uniref:Serine--tRNA ligase n=1 Tax=Proteinivorax hydrogeniformans TaxID=1826727 RepID=A0AAU8HT79_9FIRM
MIDLKILRKEPETFMEAITKRGGDPEVVKKIQELDKKRRELLGETENLKRKRNEVSKEIAQLKREKKDAEEKIKAMRKVGDDIKGIDTQLADIEEKVTTLALEIPNVPNESVPVGTSEEQNQQIKKWGEIPKFEFQPKAHWDVGGDLDILDFERAGKVTGTRFVFLKGLAAKLERALINFMLDTHQEHGYTELMTPYMVNSESMQGTGQFPKFKEDAFSVENKYYLIPTAEVPVTNFHRDEILASDELPRKFTAFTPCFRAEAGAHGRDTRGLIRQHQFNKVELVKITKPEESYFELEKLLEDAERILRLLKLPYRVVNLCTGDLGFSAAKTYDIEVWFPSFETYREISSCSNFEDFQARRANIKYREQPKHKAKLVHTLNGSGLAVGRTVAAILENYQNEDGTVTIPEVLRPYLGGKEKISK